jgi:signal transduction histidine kinase
MKISVKHKLFFICISIILGYICSIFLLNFTILEDYFISKVNKNIVNTAYKTSKFIDDENNFDVKKYLNLEYKTVIKSIIMTDNEIIYNTAILPENLDIENLNYVSSKDFMINNINKFTENPSVEYIESSLFNNKIVRLLYKFEKNEKTYFVCVFSSYGQIKQYIKIFNRFCLIFGLIILLIFGVAIFIIVNVITKPIIHINEVTKKLSLLDFSERIKVDENDEIGTTSLNINLMADKLENTLNELIISNNEKSKDIFYKEKVDESRRYFLSSVSHELKTPISLIVGYAEAIKYKDKKTPVDYYCDIIIDEGDKMNKLVGDILRLSQMDSKIMPINKEQFSIIKLIEKYVRNFDIIIKEKKIDIELNFNSDENVYADYELISQVVNNYLSNAINHLNNDNKIKIYTFNNNNMVRVSVFNSGNHILEENLSKVWDSFFKEDKARTREYGGHGFGLTIVKSVMERHGTNYGVNNVDGGVTFYFEIEKYNETNIIDKDIK